MKCNCEQSFETAAEIVDQYKDQKGSLITMLQKIQQEYGYIPQEVIEQTSQQTNIPESVIFGVATFYSQFRLEPAGKHIIRVCQGTACHVSGSKEITSTLENILSISDGETTEDGLFTLESVACLGCCSLAPVMTIDGNTYGKLDSKKAAEIVSEFRKEAK